MKVSIGFLMFILYGTLYSQDASFRPTYVFEGHIQADKKLAINLNFLILLDSTMVGSYYYKPKNGPLKIVGHLNKDNSFELVERDSKETITGFFKGQLMNNYETASGMWFTADRMKHYQFVLKQIHGDSYWDYIKKFRSLYEYRNIEEAIKEPDRVASIDVASKGLTSLPSNFNQLSHLLSINLLGNQFETFPIELTELRQIEEISLSSNKLKYVGSEIGGLSNLRILIMNFNQLSSLPKEIGKLKNLLYLELGRNQLTSLPEEIKSLKKLQELHIEGNQFSLNEQQKIKSWLPKCIIHF